MKTVNGVLKALSRLIIFDWQNLNISRGPSVWTACLSPFSPSVCIIFIVEIGLTLYRWLGSHGFNGTLALSLIVCLENNEFRVVHPAMFVTHFSTDFPYSLEVFSHIHIKYVHFSLVLGIPTTSVNANSTNLSLDWPQD